MKIAILGWGSLVWDPRSLNIDKEVGKNGWFNGGPALPIEFSRISSDRRLTLVIDPAGSDVSVLFAFSTFEKMDEAILDLAVREGCSKGRIGFFIRESGETHPSDFEYEERIREWIGKHQFVEVVIWTNLDSKLFFEDAGKRINIKKENLMEYLKNLPAHIQPKAEQYVRMAPSSITTPLRAQIEKELGWSPISVH